MRLDDSIEAYAWPLSRGALMSFAPSASSACWAALLRQEHGREVTSVLCVHVIDPETDPCNPTRLVGRQKDCIVGQGIIAGLVLCRTPRL